MTVTFHHMPAGGGKTSGVILRYGQVGNTVISHAIVIVKPDQFTKLEMTGEADGFVVDPQDE